MLTCYCVGSSNKLTGVSNSSNSHVQFTRENDQSGVDVHSHVRSDSLAVTKVKQATPRLKRGKWGCHFLMRENKRGIAAFYIKQEISHDYVTITQKG